MSWYDPSHTAGISNLESSVSREYKRERERVLRNSPSHCFSCGHPIKKDRCYVALLSTGNFSRLNESTKEVTRKQKGDETKTTVSTETIVNFTCDSCRDDACAKKFDFAIVGDAEPAAGSEPFDAEDIGEGVTDVDSAPGDEVDGNSSQDPPWRQHLIGFLSYRDHLDYRKYAQLQWSFRTFGYIVLDAKDVTGRLSSTDFGKSSVFTDFLNSTKNESVQHVGKRSLCPEEPSKAVNDRLWQIVDHQNVRDTVDKFSNKDSPYIDAKPFHADLIYVKLAWLYCRQKGYELYKQEQKKKRSEEELKAVSDDISNIRWARASVQSTDYLVVEATSLLCRKPIFREDNYQPNPQEVHCDRQVAFFQSAFLFLPFG